MAIRYVVEVHDDGDVEIFTSSETKSNLLDQGFVSFATPVELRNELITYGQDEDRIDEAITELKTSEPYERIEV